MSPSFTGFSGKPVQMGKSFSVTAPSDYTIEQLLNNIQGMSDTVSFGCQSEINTFDQIAAEFRIKSKLTKDRIRANVSGKKGFIRIRQSIAAINIRNGDTLNIILSGRPIAYYRLSGETAINPTFDSQLETTKNDCALSGLPGEAVTRRRRPPKK